MAETGTDEAAPPQPPPLRLHDLTVRAGQRCLLEHVDAVFPAAKITVVVGGSGAGKSVLLRILAGLLPPAGEGIRWSGQITAAEDASSAPPRVGIVFQQFALFDELSPTANVQFAIDHGPRERAPQTPPSFQTRSARQWLQHLGVPPTASIAHLSGGQKQRLAIARTLAAAPEILLYDEPTSGLDSASGRLVADLIRETQSQYHRTSIVVTHDYHTLLPIADQVLLFDPVRRDLIAIPRDQWEQIPERMVPVAQLTAEPTPPEAVETRTGWRKRLRDICGRSLETTGGALLAAMRLPLDLFPWVPRLRWAARFTLHYLRLVAGPSAWAYLVIAGLIIGFTSTYFTFRFLPFRLYTQPLLIDELLATIGFMLYRVLVPILATILIAARCGAAVAADVGVKQYGGQVDALRTLGVPPRAYLLVPIAIAFLVGTPLLEALAFQAARLISMVAFSGSYPDIGPYFWNQHFGRNLRGDPAWLANGWGWVLLKNLACGLGTATIAYYQGLAPKGSASDVSRSITATVLWATLFVLTVHFTVAWLEF